MAVVGAPAPGAAAQFTIQRQGGLRRDAFEVDPRIGLGVEAAHHEAGLTRRRHGVTHRRRQKGVVDADLQIAAVMVAEPDVVVPHLGVTNIGGETQGVRHVIGGAGHGDEALLGRDQRTKIVVGRPFAAHGRRPDLLAEIEVAQRTVRIEGLARQHARHDQPPIGGVGEADVRQGDETTGAVIGRHLPPATDTRA